MYQFSPDSHATYPKLIFLVLLGSKLIGEGEFLHARFMDYQILTPVDPEHSVTGQMGICEVPIVGVDIDSLPGHVNLFRKGTDRGTENRSYHVVFDLEARNASELNPEAMKAPAYRAGGNYKSRRPHCLDRSMGRVLVPSVLWLCYYACDKDA